MNSVSGANVNNNTNISDIQNIIDNTADDTIIFDSGDYNYILNLNITRAINIISNGIVTFIGDGKNNLFNINSTGVKIDGFNIKNYETPINSTEGNLTIINNNITNSTHGIIINNTKNSGNAIINNTNIENNKINTTRETIEIAAETNDNINSSSSHIENIQISNNELESDGVDDSETILIESSNNSTKDVKINNNKFKGGELQKILVYSSKDTENIAITNNNFNNNESIAQILVLGSQGIVNNTTISNNNFNNNILTMNIYSQHSINNIISHNNIHVDSGFINFYGSEDLISPYFNDNTVDTTDIFAIDVNGANLIKGNIYNNKFDIYSGYIDLNGWDNLYDSYIQNNTINTIEGFNNKFNSRNLNNGNVINNKINSKNGYININGENANNVNIINNIFYVTENYEINSNLNNITNITISNNEINSFNTSMNINGFENIANFNIKNNNFSSLENIIINQNTAILKYFNLSNNIINAKMNIINLNGTEIGVNNNVINNYINSDYSSIYIQSNNNLYNSSISNNKINAKRTFFQIYTTQNINKTIINNNIINSIDEFGIYMLSINISQNLMYNNTIKSGNSNFLISATEKIVDSSIFNNKMFLESLTLYLQSNNQYNCSLYNNKINTTVLFENFHAYEDLNKFSVYDNNISFNYGIIIIEGIENINNLSIKNNNISGNSTENILNIHSARNIKNVMIIGNNLINSIGNGIQIDVRSDTENRISDEILNKSISNVNISFNRIISFYRGLIILSENTTTNNNTADFNWWGVNDIENKTNIITKNHYILKFIPFEVNLTVGDIAKFHTMVLNNTNTPYGIDKLAKFSVYTSINKIDLNNIETSNNDIKFIINSTKPVYLTSKADGQISNYIMTPGKGKTYITIVSVIKKQLKLIFKLKLTDKNKKPLKGKYVTFIIGNEKFNLITDSNGIATLNYKIRNIDSTNTIFKFLARFNGDDNYLSSEKYDVIKLTKNKNNVKTKNNPDAYASMKKTGTPIIAILLILISSLGILKRRK